MKTCAACGAAVAFDKHGKELPHNSSCYMDGNAVPAVFEEEPMDTVTLYERTDGKWAWHRRNAENGNVVSTDGGQGYENYNDAYDQAFKQFGDTVQYERKDS